MAFFFLPGRARPERSNDGDVRGNDAGDRFLDFRISGAFREPGIPGPSKKTDRCLAEPAGFILGRNQEKGDMLLFQGKFRRQA
jgi:hypothetical protein